MRVFDKEELRRKNILLHKSGQAPEKLELYGDMIKIHTGKEIYEIPLNTLRAKAILDRLNYDGELTQEIYI
jgi:hypothetical protein